MNAWSADLDTPQRKLVWLWLACHTDEREWDPARIATECALEDDMEAELIMGWLVSHEALPPKAPPPFSTTPHPLTPTPGTAPDFCSPSDDGKRVEEIALQGTDLGAQHKLSIEEEFDTLMAIYPKRDGRLNRRDALRAYNARRKEKVPYQEIMDGLRGYKSWCEVRGFIGTGRVMMASTFFGPSKPWAEDWGTPAVAAPQGKNNPEDGPDAMEAFLRGCKVL